ncbi:MAG: hypothetical protein U9R08_00140 [Nanoarchaeota archaeon]|nr:hypothetical protein [Nanoarchaeota archaeon]
MATKKRVTKKKTTKKKVVRKVTRKTPKRVIKKKVTKSTEPKLDWLFWLLTTIIVFGLVVAVIQSLF